MELAVLPAAIAGFSRIVLEIGCGNGHFLVEYAQAYPQDFCVGIDLKRGRLARSEVKKIRRGLANVTFIKAEAREFLTVLPPDLRFDCFWILYPDPWPKTRHFKNRIIQTDFLDLLATRSQPKARLYFRSDHRAFFEWTQRCIAGHASWRLAEANDWPFEASTVFQSYVRNYFSLAATYVGTRPDAFIPR